MKPNLERLAEAFDPATMDALLLLAPVSTSIGYSGRGDFTMAPDGRLTRRAEREIAPFVYAGAAILRPELFKDAPDGAFSLTTLFDRAAAEGRLHGLRLEGVWMHVGTPEAIAQAEAAIAASAGSELPLVLSTAALICGDSANLHRPHRAGDDTMQPPWPKNRTTYRASSRFRRRRRSCRR